ncbi:oxygenase MpaB family protein [Actinosynnema sp. NPDC020468]|uniref:oxygenase MpaB family protein n=1 Tax=Actinosynnema sp. NPDC020468 TaxID=3154488 RepID=UPI0033F47811
MPDRYATLRRIESLDPVADHHEILRLSSGYEFPWDYVKALEFALFRTYCVPSISGLLARTGEFAKRPQKRYDDTALLMAELVEHGYDSPRGKEALRVVNRLHGRYAIANDDLRYVLSTFVYDPVDWLTRFGWRPPSDHEALAAFHFYREVGARMGVKDIPRDYAEFRRFKEEFEEREFVYSDTNRAIGTYTIDLFCSWYPLIPARATRTAILSFLDPRMSRAFGFPRPSPTVTLLTGTALKLRSHVVRHLPPRRASTLTTQPKNRTYRGYPTGYHPSDLGAP